MLLKVLTRCIVMYENLSKLQTIFKLMRKRQEIEARFADFDKNWTTGNKFSATAEQKEALYKQKMQALE